jgi:hypothetical protein
MLKIILILSLLIASFNAQSAVTACPSGWTKSADGLTCVLETKTTQTPNQVSNTTKPVCISGFTYSSTSMKCEQITIASQFTKYKGYEFTGGLRFGNNPVEQYSCPNGGTLNGSLCTKIYEPEPIKCENFSASQVGYEGSRSTMTLQCNGTELKVTARGAGSDGGLIYEGDFWKTLDLDATYSSTPLVPVAGHWSGSYRQGALFATGSCSNGNCSYRFFMQYSSNAWDQVFLNESCPNGWTRSERKIQCSRQSCNMCGNLTGTMGGPHKSIYLDVNVDFHDPRYNLACKEGTFIDKKCIVNYPATSIY